MYSEHVEDHFAANNIEDIVHNLWSSSVIPSLRLSAMPPATTVSIQQRDSIVDNWSPYGTRYMLPALLRLRRGGKIL